MCKHTQVLFLCVDLVLLESEEAKSQPANRTNDNNEWKQNAHISFVRTYTLCLWLVISYRVFSQINKCHTKCRFEKSSKYRPKPLNWPHVLHIWNREIRTPAAFSWRFRLTIWMQILEFLSIDKLKKKWLVDYIDIKLWATWTRWHFLYKSELKSFQIEK